MWFGTLPVAEAQGCILAHSVKVGTQRFRKGARIDATLHASLISAGVTDVVVARLDASDVHEDRAAEELAAAIAGRGVVAEAASTGRVNLFAQHDGLLCLNAETMRAVNAVDEAITLATLPEDSWVQSGRMIATSKIISYGVAATQLHSATQRAEHKISVAPLLSHAATLVQTQLPSIKESVLNKTRAITEQRLAARNVILKSEHRCVHEVTALTSALQSIEVTDWILIAGASAISDRGDVIPQSIIAAGGTVTRYGIPVDPGNLILLGELNGRVVIGLPGCARSPKLNGLDLILNRLACGIDVSNHWLNSLSVGGLLAEMHDRPQPRVQANTKQAAKVAALVLAAGLSKRAGKQNKLLFEVDGVPMVKTVVELISSSNINEVHVVTGHEHQQVEAVLAQSDCATHYCANYEMGLAHSLSHGISRLEDVDAVMVFLGDMPDITPVLINQILAFESGDVRETIRIPVYHGKRGNPVMVGRGFFDTLLQHTGDSGARHLIQQYPDLVVEVPVHEAGVLNDYDTPEALATLQNNR